MDDRLPGRALARSACSLAIAALLASCAPEPQASFPTAIDLRPPGLLEAGPEGPSSFQARFDEAIVLVPGSLALEPAISLGGTVEGRDLSVSFGGEQSPGLDYRLSGEVEDLRGNRTRFLVNFVGWNDRVPAMRLSELQTGKNSSKTNPHRDYIELEILEGGNVGGAELAWSSSVKSMSYRFPGIEVAAGDFIVLHLAPEGVEAEVDELGPGTDQSGGVDATAAGRDLWSLAGALPDENGAVGLRDRPGGPFVQGFFYADDEKAGPAGANKLSDLVAELARSGAWPLAGNEVAWSDAFGWHPSSSRSMCRFAEAVGKASWYVTESSGQSPGSANPAP